MNLVKKRRRSSVWIIILLASAFLILVSSVRPVAAQSVTLTPNVGTGGTLVQISGSGFGSPSATGYTVSALPNSGSTIFSTDILTSSTTICNNLGSGSCVGTFHVDAAAPAGIYVVSLLGTGGSCPANCGPVFAQFVVGAPSAYISLSPTIASAGTVTISGSGFSIADTGCTISTGNPTLDTQLSGSSPIGSCSMSVGNAGGAFTVKSGASPGLYLITVSGCVGGPPCPFPYSATDFASAYFEVPSATTTIYTSVSILTLTSSTATVTTSTTAIVSSLTTTSVSSTGVSTEQSSAFTLATYLAQSTSTSTSTSFTTSTVTLASTQRTTTTLFTTSFLGGTGIITPLPYSPPSEMVNIFGIISVIGLIGPILLRRLLT